MAANMQHGTQIVWKLRRWLRRRQRSGLAYDGFTQPAGPGPLQGMQWHEFELLVGDAFRLLGYSVSRLDEDDTDDEADLVLRRNGKTLLVAYRQWNVAIVGPEAVHGLHGVAREQKVEGGVLLTLGRFSPQAKAAAQATGVELMDGSRLVPVIEQAQATRMSETAPAPLEARLRGRR